MNWQATLFCFHSQGCWWQCWSSVCSYYGRGGEYSSFAIDRRIKRCYISTRYIKVYGNISLKHSVSYTLMRTTPVDWTNLSWLEEHVKNCRYNHLKEETTQWIYEDMDLRTKRKGERTEEWAKGRASQWMSDKRRRGGKWRKKQKNNCMIKS